MQTITLRETIGDDGILRLQMPLEPRGGEVEVVVVIQPQNGQSNGQSSEKGAKPRSFADFAGTLQDETFEVPEELPWETNRLPLE